MPLSNLTWTRARWPCARAREATSWRKSSRQTASSEPAEITSSTSSAVRAPIVSSGTCWKRRPICSASPAVATASRLAPPSSAAAAQTSAPWP